MNYRNVLFSVLLLPAIAYGNSGVESVESRIKQLEIDRFKKEEKIALLSARIYDEAVHYQNYLSIASMRWKNPESDSLHEFIIQVANAFGSDKDIEALCKDNPFIAKRPIAYWDIKRAVVQLIFIGELVDQYDQLVNELVEMNRQLES